MVPGQEPAEIRGYGPDASIWRFENFEGLGVFGGLFRAAVSGNSDLSLWPSDLLLLLYCLCGARMRLYANVMCSPWIDPV